MTLQIRDRALNPEAETDGPVHLDDRTLGGHWGEPLGDRMGGGSTAEMRRLVRSDSMAKIIPVLFLAIALINAVITAGAALYSGAVERHGLVNPATAAPFFR